MTDVHFHKSVTFVKICLQADKFPFAGFWSRAVRGLSRLRVHAAFGAGHGAGNSESHTDHDVLWLKLFLI